MSDHNRQPRRPFGWLFGIVGWAHLVLIYVLIREFGCRH
jgi:hypothetical protein